MRPINLIPAEQRRGASRGHGARTSFSGYIVARCAGRGSRVRARRRDDLEPDQLEDRGAGRDPGRLAAGEAGRRRTAPLRPVRRPPARAHDAGQDALPRAATTGSARCASSRRRFRATSGCWPWRRPSRRASSLTRGRGRRRLQPCARRPNAPAFTISGCTYSQHAVARMMTRMRNLDDVTAVQLAKSVRKDSSDVQRDCRHGGPQQQAQQQEDIQDCTGSDARDQVRHRWSSSAGRPPPARPAAQAAVPPGAAAPIADANAAAAQGGAASAAAGGTTP